MKRLFIIALFTVVTLLFTGCSNQQNTMTLKEAQEVYGMDYQVITLSNKDFLISWDHGNTTTDIIFNNNKAVTTINHESKLENVISSSEGVQLNFSDNTGYWYE